MALTRAQLNATVVRLKEPAYRLTPLRMAYERLCDFVRTTESEYLRSQINAERDVNELLTNQCMELENTVERLERRVQMLEKEAPDA